MYDVLSGVDVCQSGFGPFRKSRPLDGVLFGDFDSLKSIKIVSCQKKCLKNFVECKIVLTFASQLRETPPQPLKEISGATQKT